MQGSGYNGYYQEIPKFKMPDTWNEYLDLIHNKGVPSSLISQKLKDKLWAKREEEEKLKEQEVINERKRQWAIDRQNKSSKGEICLDIHTDWVDFAEFFQSKISGEMFRIWIKFSRLHCDGKELKVSVRNMAKLFRIDKNTVVSSLHKLSLCSEVCPICGQSGFRFLEKVESYDYTLENDCDRYSIQCGIEYLYHLRLHIREIGWDKFREEFEKIKPEW